MSRVLRGAGFDSEFLLACEEWMHANLQFGWEGAAEGVETYVDLSREDSREVDTAADLGFRMKKRTARKNRRTVKMAGCEGGRKHSYV